MRTRFIRDLALVLVLNLLVKPFYILGIDAGVQERVGAATYGNYAALLSLSFLLNIVLDLGMTNYNTRHVARHPHLMAKYLGGMAAVRGVLMVCYAVATVGAGLLLGFQGPQLELLVWLVVNQALAATILYLRGHVAGAHRFRQDSLLSVVDRALMIGIMGWLLWGRASGSAFAIEWFVWAQTAAYAITALLALALVLRLSGPVRPRWRPAFSLMVLRQSLPFALLVLLMTIYYRTDTLMLERLLPEGAWHAGIYAQGFRFFEALNMLGYLLAGLLLPRFSRMLKEGDPLGPLAGNAMRLVWAGAIPVAIAGSFHATAWMDLRYTEHTDLSGPVFAILLWCFVAVCTTYVYGTLLTAAGDLRSLNWMAAAGMVLNIGLNLALIPRYQALGAAWASLITQGLTAVVQVVLATRRHGLVPPIARFVGPLCYALVLTGAAWGMQARGVGAVQAAFWLVVIALPAAFVTRTLRHRMLHEPLPQPQHPG